MPKVKCKICETKFYVKPSHQKLGLGKYCSIKCCAIGRRKGKNVICHICGSETWKRPKALNGSKSGKFFCSKKCQTIWRNKYYSGKNHANWKGGEYTYPRIMKIHKIEPVCTHCNITDKRVLVIHHKDWDRKNNSIDNLMWLCRNCHCLVHVHNVKI